MFPSRNKRGWWCLVVYRATSLFAQQLFFSRSPQPTKMLSDYTAAKCTSIDMYELHFLKHYLNTELSVYP